MNIVMMTNTFLPHVGGVARSVATFTQEYRKQGHDTLVVAPEFPTKDATPPPEEERVVRLAALQKFNGSDFSVRLPLTAILNDELSEFPAQVVHSHHPFLLGDTALRIGASKHAPVIFTHHTLYEEYTHYVPFDSEKMKQFIIELSTEYANLCDGVIAPSESIARIIQDRGVVSPIEVVPTGIDVAAFAGGDGSRFRKALGIPPRAFVIGYCSRLAPEKNLQYLTDAVINYLKSHPKSYFLVIGKGPSEADIRERFARAGLSDMLIMAGEKCGSDLHDAYRAMNVFAFSSFSETQGMVLAEAMAAGLPVVALDASGVREIVRNDRNGFLLPSDAPPEFFARHLEILREDSNLRRRMKGNAQRTASRYSKEVCADKALNFYEKVRAATRSERRELAADPWGSLVHQIKMEWELLSQKTMAAVHAVMSESKEAPSDRPS